MQTVDSNLDANKTINNSRKEQVLQGQEIGRQTSNLALEVVDDHEVSQAGVFTGCAFVSHRLLVLACLDNDEDDVIPRMDIEEERPPYFLPILG